MRGKSTMKDTQQCSHPNNTKLKHGNKMNVNSCTNGENSQYKKLIFIKGKCDYRLETVSDRTCNFNCVYDFHKLLKSCLDFIIQN